MIITSAELNLKITKEACRKKEKEELGRIENKFKDFLDYLAKQILEAAFDGKSSIKISNENFAKEDWDDIDWYLTNNHYDVWWWDDDMVISWSGK